MHGFHILFRNGGCGVGWGVVNQILFKIKFDLSRYEVWAKLINKWAKLGKTPV